MSADLSTFAKVRSLHDRAAYPGEKAAAAQQMKALAKKAGLTVAQAKAQLDRPTPKPRLNPFEELFNSPEFRARHAERERIRAEKCAALLREYGSEAAVFADSPMEAALRQACVPLLGPGEHWDGIYRLDGWGTLDARSKMPESVFHAVSGAWPMPATVVAAWDEYQAIDKAIGDRCAFNPDHNPHAFVEARQHLAERLLDGLPAKSLNDIRARLSWLDFWADAEVSRDPAEDRIVLAVLRADIERMAETFRAGGAP